jgi:hypothetical protein
MHCPARSWRLFNHIGPHILDGTIRHNFFSNATWDTYQPSPEGIQLVLGRRFIIRICLDLGDIAIEIHFGSGEQWRALPQFGSNVQNGEEHQWKVVRHEGGEVPFMLQEHRPATKLNSARHDSQSCSYIDQREKTYEAYDEARDCSIPCSKRLQVGEIWKRTTIQALCFGTGIEADVGDGNAEPGQQTSDGGHIREPAEDLA